MPSLLTFVVRCVRHRGELGLAMPERLEEDSSRVSETAREEDLFDRADPGRSRSAAIALGKDAGRKKKGARYQL